MDGVFNENKTKLILTYLLSEFLVQGSLLCHQWFNHSFVPYEFRLNCRLLFLIFFLNHVFIFSVLIFNVIIALAPQFFTFFDIYLRLIHNIFESLLIDKMNTFFVTLLLNVSLLTVDIYAYNRLILSGLLYFRLNC